MISLDEVGPTLNRQLLGGHASSGLGADEGRNLEKFKYD